MGEEITETWSCFAKVYDPLKIGSIDGTDTEPHDKGIIRAINSEYKPNKHVKGKPGCTIFVSRLSPKTTKDTIKDIFSRFGRLKRFRLVKDIVTGFPKGYAFIEYDSENAAEDAYRKAYKMNIDGHTIFVDFECERLLKGWKPRRLGGGFGGRKESGQLRFGCRDRPFRKPISLEVKEQEERLKREKELRATRESEREERRNRDRDYDSKRSSDDMRKRKHSRSSDRDRKQSSTDRDKKQRSTDRDRKQSRSTERDEKQARTTDRDSKKSRSTDRDIKHSKITNGDGTRCSTNEDIKQSRSTGRNRKQNSTDRDRKRSRSTNRNGKRNRSISRDKKRSRSINRDRKRSRSTNRDRKRSRSTHRDRKRSRSTNRDRKRSRSTNRDRKRSRSTSRDKKRSRRLVNTENFKNHSSDLENSKQDRRNEMDECSNIKRRHSPSVRDRIRNKSKERQTSVEKKLEIYKEIHQENAIKLEQNINDKMEAEPNNCEEKSELETDKKKKNNELNDKQ